MTRYVVQTIGGTREWISLGGFYGSATIDEMLKLSAIQRGARYRVIDRQNDKTVAFGWY
jgi:cell division protein FtsW (lipid II flippase)